MKKPVVFMFSGQGSQYFGMARDLFDAVTSFRDWMKRLDRFVFEINGRSVLEYLYDKSKNRVDKCDNLKYTHPAIFMVEYSLAMTLIEMGIYPDIVLGSSLGEFTSLAVSGVLSFEDVLDCILKQSEYVEALCPKGGMMAVFHPSELYQKSSVVYKNSELAGINYDSHFVISGKKENLKTISDYFKKVDVLYQELPVEYAFHSNLIDNARLPYLDLLRKKSYKYPEIPIVSSLYGKAISNVTSDFLWNVTREPIRFNEAIASLEKSQSYTYLGLDPGSSLVNFANRSMEKHSSSIGIPIITIFNQDIKNFQKVQKLFSEECNPKTGEDEKDMLAYVFPGQGSQQKGMCSSLFDEFSDLISKADEILGYSIKELCMEDPENKLNQTQYTQPALYIVNALSYLKKIKDTGLKPDFVAGHSLGEYNALFAAGAFDFLTGLTIVKKRAELMSQATGGGMAAVVGLDYEKIKEVLENNNLQSIDVANFNTPTQIVISGLKEDVEKAKPFFEAAGARNYVVLKVSGAFHSRYMVEASKKFEEFLEDFEFSDLSIPVISNVYARPYKSSRIKSNLVEQIRNSVKWTDIIRYFMGKGVNHIEQVGPGTVLTGMVKSILRDAEPLIVEEEDNISIELENNQDIVEEIRDEAVEKEKDALGEDCESMQKTGSRFSTEKLGSEEFKNDYGLKYAYVSGGMYRGIASTELVIRMAKAGLMGIFGTGGLDLSEVEKAIRHIKAELSHGEAFGMNFLTNLNDPQNEEDIVDLFLRFGVNNIEASAFMTITPALARLRLNGLKRNTSGIAVAKNRIIGKVSRPEVAEMFLSPVPERIVKKLLDKGMITREEAELSKELPIADDLCVEADSGGHTDHGVAHVLMPAMLLLRDRMMAKYNYKKKIRVGLAGGIGTPQGAAAAFVMGADFIMTGSINQCTVEACTSDSVKDLLQQIDVQDTEYAPAGDMFEMGAKVQVLKKGVFFPARANKLYDLYRQFNSIDEIDDKTKVQIQERYFKKSFEKVYEDIKNFLPAREIEKAEQNPKHKMALLFKWYFGYSSRQALSGAEESRVDYQIHCGPALGAFNQWVKGTALEDWRNRHVDEIGIKLMTETADFLVDRLNSILR